MNAAMPLHRPHTVRYCCVLVQIEQYSLCGRTITFDRNVLRPR